MATSSSSYYSAPSHKRGRPDGDGSPKELTMADLFRVMGMSNIEVGTPIRVVPHPRDIIQYPIDVTVRLASEEQFRRAKQLAPEDRIYDHIHTNSKDYQALLPGSVLIRRIDTHDYKQSESVRNVQYDVFGCCNGLEKSGKYAFGGIAMVPTLKHGHLAAQIGGKAATWNSGNTSIPGNSFVAMSVFPCLVKNSEGKETRIQPKIQADGLPAATATPHLFAVNINNISVIRIALEQKIQSLRNEPFVYYSADSNVIEQFNLCYPTDGKAPSNTNPVITQQLDVFRTICNETKTTFLGTISQVYNGYDIPLEDYYDAIVLREIVDYIHLLSMKRLVYSTKARTELVRIMSNSMDAHSIVSQMINIFKKISVRSYESDESMKATIASIEDIISSISTAYASDIMSVLDTNLPIELDKLRKLADRACSLLNDITRGWLQNNIIGKAAGNSQPGDLLVLVLGTK